MSEHITHTPITKRLERSSSSKYVAGVAGGLGRYFDLNPNVFRLGFVVLTIVSAGAGVLIYLAAVLVIPKEGREQSIAGEVLAARRERPWPVIGLGLAGAALIVLLTRGATWAASGAGWTLILIVGLIVLWSTRRERRARRILVALTSLATLVAVVLAVAVAASFAWFNVSLGDGVGDKTYRPATQSLLEPDYKLGIGRLTVDLSSLAANAPRQVDARVGIGRLKVIVPRDATVAVDARAKAGDIHDLGLERSGRNVGVRTGSGKLTIHARIGAGRIDIVRAR